MSYFAGVAHTISDRNLSSTSYHQNSQSPECIRHQSPLHRHQSGGVWGKCLLSSPLRITYTKTQFTNLELKTLLERKMVYFQIGGIMSETLFNCCHQRLYAKQRLHNDDLALTKLTKNKKHSQARNASSCKLRLREMVLALVCLTTKAYRCCDFRINCNFNFLCGKGVQTVNTLSFFP